MTTAAEVGILSHNNGHSSGKTTTTRAAANVKVRTERGCGNDDIGTAAQSTQWHDTERAVAVSLAEEV